MLMMMIMMNQRGGGATSCRCHLHKVGRGMDDGRMGHGEAGVLAVIQRVDRRQDGGGRRVKEDGGGGALVAGGEGTHERGGGGGGGRPPCRQAGRLSPFVAAGADNSRQGGGMNGHVVLHSVGAAAPAVDCCVDVALGVSLEQLLPGRLLLC